MTRRRLLQLGSASALALALPLPALATSGKYAEPDWAERNLISDAITTVETLWMFGPVQGQAFGFPMWTIANGIELAKNVRRQLYDDGDPMMWERVYLWAQMRHAMIKRFGSISIECCRWVTRHQPLPTYTVADYLLTGNPTNIRSILRDLETPAA